MDGFAAIYIFTLAAITGYEIIMRVPVILHTPLMSGSNFVHGVVLVGAMVSLGAATTPFEQAMGFFAVLLGAANAAGGYVVTERMLAMFKPKAPANKEAAK
jgi:NAD(P) transhydrogenase subunit alpha